MEATEAPETPSGPEHRREPQAAEASGWSPNELARKGGIGVALLVLVVSLFYLFAAVGDVIRIWLEPRWVPVWETVFALAVAALSVHVILRLTR